MGKTPETDAIARVWHDAGKRIPRLWVNHSSTLEAERDELRAENQDLRAARPAVATLAWRGSRQCCGLPCHSRRRRLPFSRIRLGRALRPSPHA